ncbi:MAG: LuxR C-terminal-related transcriptional regulator, partial [Anaerolineae bacterium]
LDYMPPQMTLVITSRTDPGFPISRLRARRELIEIRADDLRFSQSEVADFFQQTMGLKLSSDQMAVLEQRTEGWVAGLQMAALSLQNRDDKASAEFVNQFSGSHRFVLDFLVEEVLAGLPDKTRQFLLSTSILDRLCGPICKAITGRNDAQQQLEELESSNLFLIPLDHNRTWYRYHHLFADVLKAHARHNHQEQMADWHRGASEWYAQNGTAAEAIRHAYAAKDFELAAGQVELVWGKMERSFQEVTWLSWVQGLPEKLIRQRPVLCAGYAWALLDTGQFEQIEKVKSLLDQAEQWLETPTADMVVVDQKEFESLPAKIAAARAYIAHAVGDLPATMRYAQLTLDLLPEDDHFYRGIPTVTLGLAQWANGDLKAAFKSFSDAVTSFQLANNLLFEMGGRTVMAEIKVAQGHLHEAVQIYKQSLQRFAEHKVPLFRFGENIQRGMYRGIGAIFCEQGDLEAAKQHIEKSQAFSEESGMEDISFMLFVVQAKLKRAQGDIENAIDLLEKAQAYYSRGRMPDIAPIGALKSRILIANGQLTKAEQWASEQSLAVGDELSYLREYDHLTFVRLLIARFRQDKTPSDLSDAQTLLSRLLAAAESDGRMRSVIECLVLQALANALDKNESAWEVPLRRALTLAQPQGYVRLFVDEGEPMFQHLQQLELENPEQKAYRDKLLAAFGVQPDKAIKSQPLVDPLSERELEILSLIAAGLKNKEIAAELIISLNTVLYHTKNIYGKLGVNKRTLAVIKATELGLI